MKPTEFDFNDNRGKYVKLTTVDGEFKGEMLGHMPDDCIVLEMSQTYKQLSIYECGYDEVISVELLEEPAGYIPGSPYAAR